ncbi:TIGR04540 family protein [Clostridium pasteurianum]|uniref:TIGR04540 family protein n=1 Tax=Clostridium pasteurianum TaxID=1501 RepID=UPI0022608679|nr:TIGR04540 family protein [Clostridium pasteurianum]UZW12857.1 TIGR04540 family protein [Clostridium pasteurianum]
MCCLEIKLFYRTQREMANVINKIVDEYWNNNIKEDELIQHIQTLFINNPRKIKKGDQFTTIIQQVCGKRRLEIINRILNMKK